MSDKIIAWRLKAPSTSGGKVYTVAVVGDVLVTSWGRSTVAGRYGSGSQCRVERCNSHDHAFAMAMARTKGKEEGGYFLDIPPKHLATAEISRLFGTSNPGGGQDWEAWIRTHGEQSLLGHVLSDGNIA